ncbi:hypothetical protein [uncultured Mycobacterium sp.]|uniref:hypothetical protein n=1 Tax=uncultured Mycobacterium sp. TaxID=171292 RepID=UPI0035C9E878
MDPDDAAVQPYSAALAAQQMMCRLTGNPTQFTEPAFTALFAQAWNARYGHGDGMPYLDVPF